MIVSLKLALPTLVAGLGVGLVISVLQAVTQIQEMTLTFVPKVVAVAVIMLVAGPWMLNTLLTFTESVYDQIPNMTAIAAVGDAAVEILTSFAAVGAPAFALTLARVSRRVPDVAGVLVAADPGAREAAGRARRHVRRDAARGAAADRFPTNIAEVAVLAVKEVLVGAALGLLGRRSCSRPCAFAGGLIDLTVGFAFANVVDPVQNAQISVMGQFYSLLASAVFVAIGGPDMVIAGLIKSFEVVPVTEMPSWPSLSGAIVNSIGGLFAVGLQVAAPVLVTLLVTDAAVGFLARIAPQMNIFGIELPGKIAAMFLLLLVTAPVLVSSIGQELQSGIAQMFRMILGGAG